AYLNRALVANDLLVGQMSGLVSSLHRYAMMDRFVSSFPLYRVPLAPSTATIANVLRPVIMPVSKVFAAIGKPVAAAMPVVGKASAGWNQALGKFETIFAIATAATQFAAAQTVVKAHANPKQIREGGGPAVAPVGYFFLASRLAQNYRSGVVESGPFSFNALETAYQVAAGESDPQGAHVKRYLEENEGLIGASVLTLNKKGAGGSVGISAVANQVRADVDPFYESDVADNSHRYAALVNQSRGDFLLNRGRRLGPPAIEGGFEVNLGSDDAGVSLGKAELHFKAGMAIETDGGSLYRWNTLPTTATEKYQWTSLDVISGVLDFYVEIRVTLAGLTSPWLPLPGMPYIKGAPLPLGGSSHQFVDKKTDRLLTFPQWLGGGVPTADLDSDALPDVPSDPEDIGGVDRDDAGVLLGGYGDAISLDKLYHIPVLLWMEVLGLTGRNTGRRPDGVVTEGAGGMPSFWSIDDGLRDQHRTPSYALAVVQDMGDMSTTDNFPVSDSGSSSVSRGLIGRSSSGGAPAQQLPAWTDLTLQTKSVGVKEAGFLNGADKPMLSLSSAELYHKRRDTKEKANLFSPFWDARLVENSPVAVMILRGLPDPVNMMRSLVANDPVDLARRYLKEASEGMLDQATELVPPPFDGMVKELGEKALPFN
ncbi:MAG: hypothetical protein ACI9OO_001439, partial [Bacteroidia bacterium]